LQVTEDLKPVLSRTANSLSIVHDTNRPLRTFALQLLEVEAVPLLLTQDEEWKGREARHSCTNSAEKSDMAKGEEWNDERNGNTDPEEEIKKWAWIEGRWSRGRQVVVSERPLPLLAWRGRE
jgi:hypothetical protein